MRFPLMFRADHDETVRILREEHEKLIAGLRQQLEERRAQYEQLFDTMLLEKCGEQKYGSYPPEVVAKMQPKPEEPVAENPPLTEEDEEQNLLTSLARTSPSKVGPTLARLQMRRTLKLAKAARPSNFQTAVEKSGNA